MVDLNMLFKKLNEHAPNHSKDIGDAIAATMNEIDATKVYLEGLSDNLTKQDKHEDAIELLKIAQELRDINSDIMHSADEFINFYQKSVVEEARAEKILKDPNVITKVETMDDSIPYPLDYNFTFTRPSEFSFDGTRYSIEDTTWRGLLLRVCALLNEHDKDLFFDVVTSGKVSGKKRPYFELEAKYLREPVKIPGTEIYVEQNFSANDTAKVIYRLLSEFKYPINSFAIYLKDKTVVCDE